MMSDFDVLDFLDEVEREEIVIGYNNIEHTAKHWSLEEKLLYLQGLILMNANSVNNENQKRWLMALMRAMDVDAEQVWELLETFVKSPEKETVLAFLKAFRSSTKPQIFLYDALTLNRLDKQGCQQGKKVIEKFAEQLKVSKEVWQAIQQLFNQAQEKGIAATMPDEKVLDKAQFQHFYEQNTSSVSSGVNTPQHPFMAHLGRFVEIPAGSFMMGSNDGKVNEKLVHKVTVKRFLMQDAPVTFAAWDAFVRENGCDYSPRDEGWGRGDRPVINVSYKDITEKFLPWLNRVTGKNFRLPSEAEWEYACRAGSTTKYSWGDNISANQANYVDSGHDETTLPVKSYKPNAFGLYDMHGNVWEWTDDCWNGNYNGAPADGSAWQKGDCSMRMLRGGSWDDFADYLRSDSRLGADTADRFDGFGFRLVQDC